MQVAGGFRDAVRARRPQRILLGREAARLEVAVHLVGRHLHESLPAPAHLLEQHLRAEELRPPEVGGAEDRAVDVRLGGEVDDRVAAAGRAFHICGDRDIALEELDGVEREVRGVAGVGELVEDDDVVAGREEPLDQVGADEAGTACDEDAHG